jgi:regulator of sirC expression with transglutaminase-like and TPR domain
LLDDPSPKVRRALLSYFQDLGKPGEKFLRELARGSNRIAAKNAGWYLSELQFADPIAEFRSFIHQQRYELETGAILLCRTVYPNLDVTAFCRELDAIAQRCRELMQGPLTVREKCRIINRVLFHELGFRGNIDDYSDPENSFLNRVLERHKGLPISLSILYILVADRCGVELDPVGVPGHFVVGCFSESKAFFIDAFDRGRFLSVDDLLEYLSGQVIEPDVSCLVPTSIREVLCRCCRNLSQHFDRANNLPLSRLFGSFVEEFDVTYEKNSQP